MVSVQQLSLSITNDEDSISTKQYIVCKHRRTSTMLLYKPTKSDRIYEIIRNSDIQQQNDINNWKTIGKYIAPTSIHHVISIRSLEAYNVFVLLTTDSVNCRIILINFAGQVLLDYTAINSIDPVCFDIDQKRREMIIGFRSASIFCFYANLSSSSNNNNLSSNHNDITLTLRRKFKISFKIGNYPTQISTVDLLEFTFMLSDIGNIVCYDTSRFDVLYILENTLFSLKPCKLWVDKFGSNFIVQSKNIDGTHEQLELLMPPNSYASCEAGQFGRIVLPLQGMVLGLKLESVGVSGETDTLLLILTNQYKVHLWRPQSTNGGTVVFECLLNLKIPDSVFTVLSKPFSLVDKFYSGLSKDFGVFDFASKYKLIPHTPISFTIGLFNAIITLGIHIPNIVEIEYQQAYMEISILNLQLQQQKVLNEVAHSKDLLYTAPATAMRRSVADIDLTMANSGLWIDNKTSGSNLQKYGYKAINDDDDDDVSSQMSETLQSILHDIAAEENELMTEMSQDSSENNHNLKENSVISLNSKDHSQVIVENKCSVPMVVATSSTEIIKVPSQIKYTDYYIDSHLALTDPQSISSRIVHDDSLLAAPTSIVHLSPMFTEKGRSAVVHNSNLTQNQRVAHVNQQPSTVFFFPQMLLLNTDYSQIKEQETQTLSSYFRICQPYGLIIYNMKYLHNTQQIDPKQPAVHNKTKGTSNSISNASHRTTVVEKDQGKDLTMHTVSRKGLLETTDRNALTAIDELTYSLCAVSYRMALLGIFTTLKEGYVFSLKPSAGVAAKPIRVEFNIKHHTIPTVILNADVFLQLPSIFDINHTNTNNPSMKKGSKAAKIVDELTHQKCLYSLFMIGDSDGIINYAVLNENNVITTNSFQAHKSPIIAILSTGDSVRPLWRIGTAKVFNEEGSVYPMAIPGSALVTIASDGEVKIWQPQFICKFNGARNKPMNKIFLIYQMQWRLAGIFNIPKNQHPKQGISAASRPVSTSMNRKSNMSQSYITSACIDPSCMNVIISFRDGSMEIWTIPGLIDYADSMTLATAQCCIRRIECHFDTIHEMNVWLHLSNTTITDIDISKQNDKRDDIISHFAAYVRGGPTLRRTVGYTYKELMSIISSSALVTSSKDQSIILWQFSLEDTGLESSASMFLCPQPCKRFQFSNTPYNGLAYIVLPSKSHLSSESVWRVTAIVNGIIVTVCEDSRNNLFVNDSSVGNEKQFSELEEFSRMMFEDDLFLDDDIRAGGSRPFGSRSSLSNPKSCLNSIPLKAPVLKTGGLVRGMSLLSLVRKHEKDYSSWHLIESWSRVDSDRINLSLACLYYDENIDIAKREMVGKSVDTQMELHKSNLQFEEFHSVELTLQPSSRKSVMPLDRNDIVHTTNESDGKSPVKVEFKGLHMVINEPTNIGSTFSPVKLKVVLDYPKMSNSRPSSTPNIVSSRPSTGGLHPVHSIDEVSTDFLQHKLIVGDYRRDLPREQPHHRVTTPKQMNKHQGDLFDDSLLQSTSLDSIVVVDHTLQPSSRNQTKDGVLMQKNLDHSFHVQKYNPVEEVQIPAFPLNDPISSTNKTITTTNNDEKNKDIEIPMINKNLLAMSVIDRNSLKSHYNAPSKYAVSPKHSGAISPLKVITSEKDTIDNSSVTKPLEDVQDHISIPSKILSASIVENSLKSGSGISVVVNINGIGKENSIEFTDQIDLEHAFNEGLVDTISALSGSINTEPSSTLVTAIKGNKTTTLRQKQQLILKDRMDLKDNENKNGPVYTSHSLIGSVGLNITEHSEAFKSAKKKILAATKAVTAFQPNGKVVVLKAKTDSGNLTSKIVVDKYHNAASAKLIDNDGQVEMKPISRKESDVAMENTGVNDYESTVSSLGMNETVGLNNVESNKSTFNFDCPVNNFVLKRLKVETFIEKLKAKVGAHKIEEQQAKIEDDGSVVSTYFDRNAAPIFVERKRPPKKVLKSKRFDKNEDTKKPYASRYANDENNTMNVTGDIETETQHSANIPTASINGIDPELNKPAVVLVDPLFSLDKFLDALSGEEREKFSTLSEEDKQRLITTMNVFYDALMNKGKKINKKTFEYFKNLVIRVKEESVEFARLNMDIDLELLDVSDKVINVNVSSVCGGKLYVVLIKKIEEDGHRPPETIIKLPAVVKLPNLIAFHDVEIIPNSSEAVTFDNLSPQTSYYVYAVANATDSKIIPITDEVKEAVHMVVHTNIERVDIEWNRLNEYMQLIEIRSALRCKWVRDAAAAYIPPVILPTDSEFPVLKENTTPADSRESSRPGSKVGSRPTSRGVSRGNDKSNTATSSSDATTKPENARSRKVDNVKLLNTFKAWWAGSNSRTSPKVRTDFHIRELIFAAREKSVLDVYRKSGIPSESEFEAIDRYVSIVNLSMVKQRGHLAEYKLSLPGSEQFPLEFAKFSSWYKGGQSLRDNYLADDLVSYDITNGYIRKMSPNTATMLEKQLEFRTAFLRSRIIQVDACVGKIADLIINHNYAEENNLKEDDLAMKRQALSEKDIIAIMSTKKLLELSIANNVIEKHMKITDIPLQSIGSLEQFNHHNIAGTDIFKVIKLSSLNPSEAPSISAAFLPGTQRKPLKAWQLCSIEEKTLEIALACTLDVVLMYAIKAGVQIPTTDDATIKPDMFPILDLRWKKFVAWYAGDEQNNPVPGKGIPTLQRVIFAEEWETRSVAYDPYVLNTLKENDYVIPLQYLEPGNKLVRKNSIVAVEKLKTLTLFGQEQMALKSEDFADGFYGPLLKLYEETVGTMSGSVIRKGLLCRHLNVVLGSRRMSIMKRLWPPGPANLANQYLFPRMGLITPQFDLPPKRTKLFPSRRPDAYTHEEILQWYSPLEYDDEDQLMIKAELKGVKLRAYYDWLAKEDIRQEESRNQMRQEDFDGHIRQEIQKKIEYRMNMHANKLKQEIEQTRINKPEKEFDFRFNDALPAEYWYVFEESQEFKFGSGIYNEDELEDLRREEERRANEAKIEAEKFENYLQEEILRREVEEQNKQKREDQDRRLAEGIVRRRRLREHLDEVKVTRQLKLEEAEKLRLEEERLKVEEALELERMRIIELHILEEIKEQQREQRLMYIEDIILHELRISYNEQKAMEYEDVMSYIREQNDIADRIIIKERIKALEKLYLPFERFPSLNQSLQYHHHGGDKHHQQQQQEDNQMKILQTLLQEQHPISDLYTVEMISLPSNQSKSVESRQTQSKINQRSDRYRRIFEGPGSGTHSENSSFASKDKSSSKDNHSMGYNTNYDWLRPTSNPIVRAVNNNPLKEEIRAISRGKDAVNTYDATWELLPNNTAQCFVKTISTPPLNVTSMRSLHKLEPIVSTNIQDISIRNADYDTANNVQQQQQQQYGIPINEDQFQIESEVSSTARSRDDQIVALLAYESQMKNLSFNSFDNQTNTLIESSSNIDRNHNEIEVPLPQQKQLIDDINNTITRLQQQTITTPIISNNTHTTTSTSFISGSSESIFHSFKSIPTKSVSELPAFKQENTKKRQKLKGLLSNSANTIAKCDQKEWLEFLQTQKNATFASLSSLNTKKVMKFDEIKPIEINKSLLNNNHIIQDISKKKEMNVSQLKKELQELGIVDESILDFKTKKLAKAASQTVIRMQTERALLREYVNSEAVLRDEYYLRAIEPGNRLNTSLEATNDKTILKNSHSSDISVVLYDELSAIPVVPKKQLKMKRVTNTINEKQLPSIGTCGGGGVTDMKDAFTTRQIPTPSSSAAAVRKQQPVIVSNEINNENASFNLDSLQTFSSISVTQSLLNYDDTIEPFGIIKGKSLKCIPPPINYHRSKITSSNTKLHPLNTDNYSQSLIPYYQTGSKLDDFPFNDSSLVKEYVATASKSKSLELFIQNPSQHNSLSNSKLLSGNIDDEISVGSERTLKSIHL